MGTNVFHKDGLTIPLGSIPEPTSGGMIQQSAITLY